MNLNFCPSDLSQILSVSILLPPSSTSRLTSYFSLILPTLNPKFIAGFLFAIYFFFLISLLCASAVSTFNSYWTVSSHSLDVFSLLQGSSPSLIYEHSSYSLQNRINDCSLANSFLFTKEFQNTMIHDDVRVFSSCNLWNPFCLISTLLIKYLFVRMVPVYFKYVSVTMPSTCHNVYNQ